MPRRETYASNPSEACSDNSASTSFFSDMSVDSLPPQARKNKLRNRTLRKDECTPTSSQSASSVKSGNSDIVEGLQVLDWADEPLDDYDWQGPYTGDSDPRSNSMTMTPARPPGNFMPQNRPWIQERSRDTAGNPGNFARQQLFAVPQDDSHVPVHFGDFDDTDDEPVQDRRQIAGLSSTRMHWQQPLNVQAAPAESRGSAGHEDGTCKPCLFISSPFGCVSGAECGFCHFRHNRSDKPRPSKLKRERFKKYQAKIYSRMDTPALEDASTGTSSQEYPRQ